MLFITVFSYLIVAVTLFLSVLALLNDRQSKKVQLYSLFGFLISIWILANTIVLSVSDPTINHIAARLITPSSVLGLYVFYILSLSYLKRSNLFFSLLTGVLSIAAIVLTVFSFTSANISQVFDSDGSYYYEFGSLYTPYVIFLLTVILGSCITLFVARTQTKGITRYQISFILLGFFLTFIPALTIGAILPLFDNFSLWDYTHLFMFILNIFVAYAVTKYSLFDIRVVTARAAGYFMVLFTVGATYIIATNIFTRSVVSDSAAASSSALAVIAIVLAISLRPLARFFNKTTDRIFYQDAYDTNEAIEELTSFLVSVNDMDAFAGGLRRQTRHNIRPSEQTLIVFQDEADAPRVHGTLSKRKLDWTSLKTLSTTVAKIGTTKGVQKEAISMLSKHNVVLYAPLTSSAGIEGVLLLGPKANGGIYTKQDVNFLKIARIDIGQALNNIKSFDKITRFSKDLQKKVAEATKELRTKNSELEDLHKTKDDFISMASHQLRPKITAAGGFLELLDQSKLRADKDQVELVELSQKSVAQMADIVNDMLDISRMEADTIMLNMDKVKTDIADLVTEEVKVFQANGPDGRFKVMIDDIVHNHQLHVDTPKVREVIQNLLANANQYSPEDTTITISVRANKQHVVVEVFDKGIGLSKQEQARLFEKFYRSDEAKRLRPTGSGIGLYVCKRIIEAHDGDMIVRSSPGKGSTFGFSLPKKKPRM